MHGGGQEGAKEGDWRVDLDGAMELSRVGTCGYSDCPSKRWRCQVWAGAEGYQCAYMIEEKTGPSLEQRGTRRRGLVLM